MIQVIQLEITEITSDFSESLEITSDYSDSLKFASDFSDSRGFEAESLKSLVNQKIITSDSVIPHP